MPTSDTPAEPPARGPARNATAALAPTRPCRPLARRRPRSSLRSALRTSLLLAAGLLAAGCLEQGESLVDAELDRIQGIRGFEVLAASPARAVLAARGRRVIVEPAEGGCIAPDSVEAARGGVFLVVSDCAIEQAAGGAAVAVDANEEMILPEAFPGVVTVSVSGAPIATGETAAEGGSGGSAALQALGRFLRSAEGRSQLGRGGASEAVEIEEMRTVDGTLYALIHEGEESELPLLSPWFWRAFFEVNERMTVATVSGFGDNPVGPDAMLRKLALQVAAVKTANGAAAGGAFAVELPALAPTPRPAEGEAAAGIVDAPDEAGEEADEAAVPPQAAAGPGAPSATPAAPRRRPQSA